MLIKLKKHLFHLQVGYVSIIFEQLVSDIFLHFPWQTLFKLFQIRGRQGRHF